MIGERHGLNLVLSKLENSYYLVECTGCGHKRPVWGPNIKRQKGCRRCSQRNMDAPITVNGKVSKEYAAWSAMVSRCTVSMPSWKERYGDTAYPEMEIESSWLGPDGYTQFYTDIGPAFEGATLDREDNTKGYLKNNVRWATASQSNTNKSNTHWLTAFGLTKPLQEWADDLGISSTAVAQRLKLGWSAEDAVSARPTGPRPSNDEYYLNIATRVAKRSTCIRRAVGCVLTDDQNYVIATAYNSLPKSFPHCTDSPCAGAKSKPGEGLHLCRSKHAEELALIKCKDVSKIKTCYVTASPCISCVELLLDTSCQRVVFIEEYPHPEASKLWTKEGRTWLCL